MASAASPINAPASGRQPASAPGQSSLSQPIPLISLLQAPAGSALNNASSVNANSASTALQSASSNTSPNAPLLNPTSKPSRPSRHWQRGHRHGKFGQLIDHVPSISDRGVFVQLTAIAATMILINLVQAALIKHLHSTLWLLVFPLVVFAIMVGILIVTAMHSWHDLKEAWSKAETPRRWAWTGIVLSVLGPIIACQFVYLNVVAIREINTVVWATTIEAPNTLVLPAVAVVEQNGFGLTILPNVSCYYSGHQCEATIATTSVGSTVLFNPVSQPNGSIEAPKQGGVFNLFIDFFFEYNSSADYYEVFFSQVPTVLIALYDASREWNDTEFWANCGDPPYYNSDYGILQSAINYIEITASAFAMDDAVKALQPVGSSNCTYVNQYAYYSSQIGTLSPSSSLTNSSCDVASSHYKGACGVVLQLSLSSTLVTTQTSGYATDTLKILTDEGGIVGGILFITWFLGIFVI